VREWKIVWSDEFTYTGLPDKSKWDYEEGFVRNEELQYYTRGRKENAWVEKDMLVIEAKRERYKNSAYTSASLTTHGRVSWRYGRIEIRAKLPSGRGIWSAFFTMGKNIEKVGWPACGEIDIMENVGFNPDMIQGTVHTTKYNHLDGTHKFSRISIPEPYKKFHVYAIEWDTKKIDFFVDDKKYFTFENEGSGVEAWPFDKEQYLILDIAVGGSWGGIKGVNNSIFPQKLYIDYIRVYQRMDVH
jgi:beta-glucanase (GH16 family)